MMNVPVPCIMLYIVPKGLKTCHHFLNHYFYLKRAIIHQILSPSRWGDFFHIAHIGGVDVCLLVVKILDLIFLPTSLQEIGLDTIAETYEGLFHIAPTHC